MIFLIFFDIEKNMDPTALNSVIPNLNPVIVFKDGVHQQGVTHNQARR